MLPESEEAVVDLCSLLLGGDPEVVAVFSLHPLQEHVVDGVDKDDECAFSHVAVRIAAHGLVRLKYRAVLVSEVVSRVPEIGQQVLNSLDREVMHLEAA